MSPAITDVNIDLSLVSGEFYAINLKNNSLKSKINRKQEHCIRQLITLNSYSKPKTTGGSGWKGGGGNLDKRCLIKFNFQNFGRLKKSQTSRNFNYISSRNLSLLISGKIFKFSKQTFGVDPGPTPHVKTDLGEKLNKIISVSGADTRRDGSVEAGRDRGILLLHRCPQRKRKARICCHNPPISLSSGLISGRFYLFG